MIGEKCFLVLAAISAFLLCAKGEIGSTSPLKTVCYRQGLAHSPIYENCSYVVLQVGSLDSKSGLVLQPYPSGYLSDYKIKFPHLKLILGLYPFDLDRRTLGLPVVINSKAGRTRVIKSAVSTIKDIGYDGIDLKFKSMFVPEIAQVASGIRLAMGSDGGILSGYFTRNITREDFQFADLAEIAKDLDFMSLECYEPSKTKPYTELVAPLYSESGSTNSVSGCIEDYVSLGAPPRKVLMGIQNYAVSHTLDDADRFTPGSPAADSGFQQYPSSKPGFLYLNQITGADWEFYRDEVSNSPYAVNYLQWASFDDMISVAEKAKYIKEKDLGGAALTTYRGVDQEEEELPFAKYVAELLSS